MKYGGTSLARRLIPALDHLSKALEATEVGEGTESVIAGVRLTLDGLRSSLESEGINEIKALGMISILLAWRRLPQYPAQKERILEWIEVIETGYRMHDRILRASKVVVAEGDS